MTASVRCDDEFAHHCKMCYSAEHTTLSDSTYSDGFGSKNSFHSVQNCEICRHQSLTKWTSEPNVMLEKLFMSGILWNIIANVVGSLHWICFLWQCRHRLLLLISCGFVVWAQDIIDNPDIHLDEMFIASLVFDLIKVSVTWVVEHDVVHIYNSV